MSKLILDPTSTAQWHRLVTDAQALSARQLDENSESYLVFLLMRYLRSDDLLRRVVALGYLRALQASGRVQSERLRDVGDQCLMLAGLFPGQARRRRVDPDYFVALGRSAYDEVHRNARGGVSELYGILAEQFLDLRDVLLALRGSAVDVAGIAEAALSCGDERASRATASPAAGEGRIPAPHSSRRH